MVLPVKLTPFEWSMLNHVVGSSPTYIAQLRISGKLNVSALKSAILQAQRRHPLLAANVKGKGPDNNFHWVAAKKPKPYIDIEPRPKEIRFAQGSQIDLKNEVGLRAWARYGDHDIDLRFQFHHACCDGLGSLKFMEDVFYCYDQIECGASQDRFQSSYDSSLAGRAPQLGQMSLPDRVRRSAYIIPLRILRMLTQKPMSIVPKPTSSTKDADELLELPTVSLTQAQTKSLRQFAVAKSISLNDLLIRDLLLTLNDWNWSHGAKSKMNLRLLIPFSLRTRAHAMLPATNCVSMVYYTFRQTDLENPDRLLNSIASQTEYVRRWKIQYSWNKSVSTIASSSFLSWLVTRKRRKKPLATGVFSNVSPIFRQTKLPRIDGKIQFGGLQLDSLHSAPPANSTVPVSFFACVYAKQLTVTLNYDPSVLSPMQANDLFENWRGQLLSTAQLSTTIGVD